MLVNLKEEKAYRQVVEVWQEEENADHGYETQDNATHGSLSARRRVDFAPAIPSKSRQCHETSSDNICDSKGHEFAVGAERHTLDTFAMLAFAAAETLSCN